MENQINPSKETEHAQPDDPQPAPDTFGERIEPTAKPKPEEPEKPSTREPDYLPVYREHDEFGEWLLR